jgi:hypothetical protein
MTCRCSFVPPFVLESMAREGIDEARLSILQSGQSRGKRNEKVVGMETLAGGARSPSGTSSREVYDCLGQWALRVKLAMDEGGPVPPDDSVKTSMISLVLSAPLQDMLPKLN